jgi:hypothetical protein
MIASHSTNNTFDHSGGCGRTWNRKLFSRRLVNAVDYEVPDVQVG